MPVDRPPRAAPGREPRLMLVSNMWPQPADASFGIFVAQQVDDLRALGLEIAVCFVDGRASRANYARGIVRLRQQLRRHRPDLVHAHHVLAIERPAGADHRTQGRRPRRDPAPSGRTRVLHGGSRPRSDGPGGELRSHDETPGRHRRRRL